MAVKAWRTSTRLSKSIDLRQVGGLEPAHEAGGRGLQYRELVLHAGAAVQQQRERNRVLPPGEERDVLLDAVLEDLEFRLVDVGDVATRASVTVTFSDTMSTPVRNAGCC